MKFLRLLLASLMVMQLCGCGSKAPYFNVGELSYLNNKESQTAVQEAMNHAGITKERQEVFFDHVDQYNETAGDLLTNEKEKLSEQEPYDAYELQEIWTAAYPDFAGYNCRITSYGLLGDFVSVEDTSEKRDEHLMFDTSALQSDASVLMNGDSVEEFSALFSIIPTGNTQDVEQHVETIQRNWKEKGITFDESAKAHMISVFFHDKWDENTNELMAGHVGVLIENQDGTLLFVEKVAFQEPYQAICFASRTELNDYLMGKYDVGNYEETARPFILENDQLMEGYRANPDNAENADDSNNEALPDDTADEENDMSTEAGEVSEIAGTIEEIKDFMLVITDEANESYALTFEEQPAGLEGVAVGDVVIIRYIGELSQVDSFTGKILEVLKQ